MEIDEVRARIFEQIDAIIRAEPMPDVSLRSMSPDEVEDFDPEASREAWETHVAERVVATVAEAMIVWDEGGRPLPLTDDQIATARIRAEQRRAESLTRRMRERVEGSTTLTGPRRAFAESMLSAFERSNARLAAIRNAGDLDEAGLQKLAEEIAGDIESVTTRTGTGDENA